MCNTSVNLNRLKKVRPNYDVLQNFITCASKSGAEYIIYQQPVL